MKNIVLYAVTGTGATAQRRPVLSVDEGDPLTGVKVTRGLIAELDRAALAGVPHPELQIVLEEREAMADSGERRGAPLKSASYTLLDVETLKPTGKPAQRLSDFNPKAPKVAASAKETVA